MKKIHALGIFLLYILYLSQMYNLQWTFGFIKYICKTNFLISHTSIFPEINRTNIVHVLIIGLTGVIDEETLIVTKQPLIISFTLDSNHWYLFPLVKTLALLVSTWGYLTAPYWFLL